MSKYKRIIGSMAILLETTTNKVGTTINSGEAVTIKGSYRGYEALPLYPTRTALYGDSYKPIIKNK